VNEYTLPDRGLVLPKMAIPSHGMFITPGNDWSNNVLIATRPRRLSGETILAFLGYVPPHSVVNPEVLLPEYKEQYLYVSTGPHRGRLSRLRLSRITAEEEDDWRLKAIAEVERRNRRALERVNNALLCRANCELALGFEILATLEDQKSNNLRMSRIEWAGILGITRESIGRILKSWEKEGLMTRNHKLRSKVRFHVNLLSEHVQRLREKAIVRIQKRSLEAGVSFWGSRTSL